MVDIVDRAARSRMMAGIGGKDTKPEMVLRRALHARGLRYRLHDRKLPGTPDLVFRRFGAVCFVHGCFWHRNQECPYATVQPHVRRSGKRNKTTLIVAKSRYLPASGRTGRGESASCPIPTWPASRSSTGSGAERAAASLLSPLHRHDTRLRKPLSRAAALALFERVSIADNVTTSYRRSVLGGITARSQSGS